MIFLTQRRASPFECHQLTVRILVEEIRTYITKLSASLVFTFIKLLSFHFIGGISQIRSELSQIFLLLSIIFGFRFVELLLDLTDILLDQSRVFKLQEVENSVRDFSTKLL